MREPPGTKMSNHEPYRDHSAEAVKIDRLIAERDEALARIQKLERDLAEQRMWLKNRGRAPLRISKIAAWGGLGIILGGIIGTFLWLVCESPVFVLLAAGLGALFGVGCALGAGNERDGVGPPGPPTIYLP